MVSIIFCTVLLEKDWTGSWMNLKAYEFKKNFYYGLETLLVIKPQKNKIRLLCMYSFNQPMIEDTQSLP